jgi:rubrerythrin
LSEFSETHREDIGRSLVENRISADRNRLYAAIARKNGDEGAARLLDAIADAEEVQVRRIRMHLRGKVDHDVAAWAEALALRKFDAYTREFPRISADLYADGRKTPAEAFEQFGQVAEHHFRLLEGRKEAGGIDPEIRYRVCGVCGYLTEGEPPKKCPVCGAVAAKFVSATGSKRDGETDAA